jgi:hypothetical protein
MRGYPFFLLAYGAATYGTTGTMPINMVFRRELCLPYAVLFRVVPYKRQPMINYMMDLVEWLHDICRFKWLLSIVHLLLLCPVRACHYIVKSFSITPCNSVLDKLIDTKLVKKIVVMGYYVHKSLI